MACADPCLDDGLGQDNPISCPVETAQNTDGATDSESETQDPTMGTATMGSATVSSMSGSQSGTLDGTDTDGDTDGETDSETEGDTDGTLWCVDADNDGFGDPENCQQSDQPIPGSVDNGDDCDDTNENTFPGAAPNDDRTACMQDNDGDNWGDDEPPPGVEPGTDCLDNDHQVFPGAAENEDPPDLCTADVDGDGWGEIDPPEGADAGTDCLDDNPDVYPGAAEEEVDPTLCAEDADGDGYGDDDPPPGAEPGTDCDDDDVNAFPGAAENEDPPNLCMLDADGDGWGDANPDGRDGLIGGADCYDGNMDLNPDTMQLTAILPYNGAPMDPRIIVSVDPATAMTTDFITLFDPMGAIPDVELVSATINESGAIYANDQDAGQIHTIDYIATCMMNTGELAPVGMPYGGEGNIVCGLEFGSDGMLYGIAINNNLLTFDPATGQTTNSIPITDAGGAPVDISSCGMALDCANDRMLVANGVDQTIYSVDTTTGVATALRDLSAFFMGSWLPTGLEYDPVSRNVWVSTGQTLFTVDPDSADPPSFAAGAFVTEVSNLQNLPICP